MDAPLDLADRRTGRPTHRATTSTAVVVENPKPLQLSSLVAEIDRSGAGNYVLLERRDGPMAEAVMQARRESDGWSVELSGVTAEAHDTYHAHVDDAAVVFATLASWLVRAKSWRDLTWERVSRPAWSAAATA